MTAKMRLGHALIDRLTMNEAIHQVLTFAKQCPCRYVVTPNSDHIMQLEVNPELQAVYRDAHLVLADGMPIVWASYLLGEALPERVTGSELMPRLCEAAAKQDLRVFLLGGPPGIAERAGLKLQQLYPGLQICGWDCPPIGFEHDMERSNAIIQKLTDAQPHITFVGLGAPKQELWMHQHHIKLKGGVLLGVGAALEFSAGTLARAPRWMQNIGAEWCYRLIQDPKRLARRYLRDTGIAWIILRDFLKRRSK